MSLSSLRAALLRSPGPSTANFSSSAVSLESKARKKARLVRKANLESKAAVHRATLASAPDPVQGFAPGRNQVWESSLLQSVLLKRDLVWGATVRAEESLEPTTTATEEGTLLEGPVTPYRPQYYNFGLTPDSVEALTNLLPKVSAARAVLDPSGSPSNYTAAFNLRAEQALAEESDKRDKLMRVIDLKNSDSRGIRVENTRRIVQAFGVKGNADTGSPEVQAAIITSRIHSLSTHLSAQTRDIHNRRSLRSLIQQRVKILKYLKSVDVARYETCLVNIGVEGRAVEGEVVVTKKVLKEGLLRASA